MLLLGSYIFIANPMHSAQFYQMVNEFDHVDSELQ